MAINVPASSFKFAVIFAVYAVLPLYRATALVIIMTWAYQYVIAYFNGVQVIPTMDAMSFQDSDSSRVNFISVTHMDKMPLDQLKEMIRNGVINFPKLKN